MNKEHFLIELKIYLHPLNETQQNIFLAKFEEAFTTGLAEGETEEMIAKSLGKPKEIAATILADFNIELSHENRLKDDWTELTESEDDENSFRNYNNNYDDTKIHPNHHKDSTFVRIFQIGGVIALNALFMIWIIFSIILLTFSGWLVTFIFLVSPILACITLVSTIAISNFFGIFFSLFLCGLGMILLYFMKNITLLVLVLLKKYFIWVCKVLKGDHRR